MAANLSDHQEITAYQTLSGNTDLTAAINEKAGQTFFRGVPVQLNAGVIQEWDGTVGVQKIAGISLIPASNYATDGAGSPPAFGQVGAPGTSTTFGKVPFESSAVNIPRGAPFADGRTLFNVAASDTSFLIQVDNSAFATAADATLVQSDIGKEFGITKDTTGHWYLDRAKTTVGTNTVCVVTEATQSLPTGIGVLNGMAVVRILAGVSQLVLP